MKPEIFVQTVVKSYKDNKGIFSNKVNAEELVPEKITSLEKALYLFYVIQLDYAIRSQNLYKGAKNLFNLNPSFFTPNYISSQREENLLVVIKENLHPRYLNEAVNRYQLNSKLLLSKYAGDPRNIFINTVGAKEVIKRIQEFRGFGPKIGNFFFRTMANVFNYEYPDISEILPPVDVHDVRIAYLLGYVANSEMDPGNIMAVKKLWNKACVDAGESWLVFDKALWLLGSEGKPKTKEDVLRLLSV